MKANKTLAIRIIIFLLLITCLFIIYFVLDHYGITKLILDTKTFKLYIQNMGIMGIVLIILLMAFAILFKLLPSAAIALASGAVFGHTWGTLYIILGAWLGAIIAFSITRVLGKNALYRLSGKRISINQQQSQAWLMWGLFVSRLIPFIPYDLMSYAMGLTPIKLWRFSIATLLGVIPTSFLLAHVGGELMMTDINELLNNTITFVMLLILPLFLLFIYIYRKGYLKNVLSGFFHKTENKSSL